jgi:hypothetical protein
MIGSELVLFPDVGPELLRLAKSAALYSHRFHVLTAFDLTDSYELIQRFYSLTETFPELRQSAIRISQYQKLAQECGDELTSLQKAGILVNPPPESFSQERLTHAARSFSSLDIENPEQLRILRSLATTFPLCAFDLFPLGLALDNLKGPLLDLLKWHLHRR